MEFKGNFLFIENTKVIPRRTNPNLINFTSPNRFEPLEFVNNSPVLGNNIDHSEESNMCVDFKRTVRNFQQTLKHNFRRRSVVVVNTHLENQMTLSKAPILPGNKSYSDVLTKKIYSRKIYCFLMTAYQVELKCIISTKL